MVLRPTAADGSAFIYALGLAALTLPALPLSDWGMRWMLAAPAYKPLPFSAAKAFALNSDTLPVLCSAMAAMFVAGFVGFRSTLPVLGLWRRVGSMSMITAFLAFPLASLILLAVEIIRHGALPRLEGLFSTFGMMVILGALFFGLPCLIVTASWTFVYFGFERSFR